MPSLQVRKLPDPIYRKLADEAEREHRSLSQQAIVVLARGLGISQDPKERRRQLLERILTRPVKWEGRRIPNPVDLIREDRDR